MIFSWQQNQWQHLWQARQGNRLPHALLFTGIEGIGKTIFADCFSRSLLCEAMQQDGLPCDACHQCRLISGRTHPNVLWIEPEKEGHAIKIDQVRNVAEFINQSSLKGKYRIVMIQKAEKMNTNAANALLKTLEEPSSGAILILITHQASLLPATILSRCQRMTFPRPPKHLALDWLTNHIPDKTVDHALLLKLADGAPLLAEQLMQEDVMSMRKTLLNGLYLLTQHQADPIKLAANIQEMPLLRIIHYIEGWIMDILRLQLVGNKGVIINHDYETQLIELMPLNDMKQNDRLLRYLQDLRRKISEGINFNKQLWIENILFQYIATTNF